MESQENA
jgi:hypothetical protein